jgi:hypothetical protein
MSACESKFLADLNFVFGRLTNGFLEDLQRVNARMQASIQNGLTALATQFDQERAVARQFLRDEIGKLPVDDPLRCPISLFRTMDFGRLETAHTRTLAWLLDPRKEHGFGTVLMQAILAHLFKTQIDDLKVSLVAAEQPLPGGRFDVFATGTWTVANLRPDWVMVIEAKVDAGEGESQLEKYSKWLDANHPEREQIKVWLAPPDRAAASEAEGWISLDFGTLARIFRKVYTGLRGTEGHHFLKFYLAGLLQDVCRVPHPILPDAPDPYFVADYLRSIRDS